MGSMEFPIDRVATHGHYQIRTARAPYPKQKLPPNGLSIIMPTYNRAENLVKAIESISRQNECWLPVEIIVVNDGSTDHTARLFEVGFNTPEWLSIKYLETGVDEWTSPANSYNLGFKHSTHNYLVHSGADIVWARKDMLNTLAAACDIDRYLIVDYWVLDVGNRPDVDVFNYIDHAKQGTTTLYPWCIVTSKVALEKIDYYSDDFRPGAGEDDAFIMEMATIGIKFCRIEGQSVVNQEHKKQYVRDNQWKDNTRHNVNVGYRRAAELRRKISRGEIEKF